MEAMFEDDLMDEELQEFILNMTPYPNGEGIQTLGGLLDESSYHSMIILIIFHTSSFSSPHLLGFSGVLTQEGIVPHFMGRRG
jgi:hypothetical protein